MRVTVKGMEISRDIRVVGPLISIIICFIILAIFLSWGYYIWNLPRCLRGHDVPRFVAEETILQPFQIGDTTIYMPSTEPAHWVKDFVCDQYEVER